MASLSSREKQIVITGVLLALVLGAVQFVLLPALDRKETLETALAAEMASFQRINVLRRQYATLSPDHAGDTAFIQNRREGFTLFSFIDRQAAKTGIKENLDYMKPDTRQLDRGPFDLSIVKLKLRQILFRDFIRFVQALESSGRGIRIASLTMDKSGPKQQRLDISIEAHARILKEAAR